MRLRLRQSLAEVLVALLRAVNTFVAGRLRPRMPPA